MSVLRIRNTIACWLCPELERDADRYHRLLCEIQHAHRWLGEFPQVEATLEWLAHGDYNYWRPLDAPAIGTHPTSMYAFREALRDMQAVPA